MTHLTPELLTQKIMQPGNQVLASCEVTTTHAEVREPRLCVKLQILVNI